MSEATQKLPVSLNRRRYALLAVVFVVMMSASTGAFFVDSVLSLLFATLFILVIWLAVAILRAPDLERAADRWPKTSAALALLASMALAWLSLVVGKGFVALGYDGVAGGLLGTYPLGYLFAGLELLGIAGVIFAATGLWFWYLIRRSRRGRLWTVPTA